MQDASSCDVCERNELHFRSRLTRSWEAVDCAILPTVRIKKSGRNADGITSRRASVRRPKRRAPDGNALSGRRSAPAAPAPGGQPARRRQQRIGPHHPVALRGDQRHPGVDQLLLRIEHIERGALADARLLAHAVERDLGGVHLRLGRLDLRLGGFELAPGLNQRLLGLVALRCRGRCGAAAASPWPDGSSRIHRRPDRPEC